MKAEGTGEHQPRCKRALPLSPQTLHTQQHAAVRSVRSALLQFRSVFGGHAPLLVHTYRSGQKIGTAVAGNSIDPRQKPRTQTHLSREDERRLLGQDTLDLGHQGRVIVLGHLPGNVLAPGGRRPAARGGSGAQRRRHLRLLGGGLSHHRWPACRFVCCRKYKQPSSCKL